MQNSKAFASSRFHFPVPCTNLMEYVFESEPKNEYWTPEQPLLLSADDSGFPGYTFDDIKTLTKALACGMRESEGSRVLIYGYWNYHFLIALLGCLGAGAVCYNSPPIRLGGSVARFESLNPKYVFVAPESMQDIQGILSEMAHPPEHVYVIDTSILSEGKTYIYKHWSSLFDFKKGVNFSWPNLSDDRSKTAPALIMNTSG